jgi:hypothetical protein
MEPGDPRAKAIEAMARAIYGPDPDSGIPWAWADLSETNRERFRAMARTALAALEQEGLILTDTREVQRLRCDFCGGAEGDFYRKALSKIAGEWHARGLPAGDRYGCSCPEFACEALSCVPAPATREEEKLPVKCYACKDATRPCTCAARREAVEEEGTDA